MMRSALSKGLHPPPAPNHVADVIHVDGMYYASEIPILLNHNHSQPVGTASLGKPTSKGIPFKAQIAKVDNPGVVKDRVDEAWYSVKAGLIKGGSIGFRPEEYHANSQGGVNYTKAEIYELSLVAIPCNPDAVIAAFKKLDEAKFFLSSENQEVSATKSQSTQKEISHMQNANNIFIRSVIANVVAPAGTKEYAAQRWGTEAGGTIIKTAMSPMGAGVDASGPLTAGTLSREQYVRAVFSRSILGQLQGVVRVPAICRVNWESAPISAKFAGEFGATPSYQGAFNVTLTDKRRLGLNAVLSRELFQVTDGAAEQVIEAQLQRALSRGLDNYFVGSQTRGEVAPDGLSAAAAKVAVAGVTMTSADSLKGAFNDGVDAFAGDLISASLLVNPRTAIKMRSAAENSITANGGQYGGLAVVASYGVPENKLFIVDAARVLAYIGGVSVSTSTSTCLPVDDGAGNMSTAIVDLFGTDQVALQAVQYTDWVFVDGAAVEVDLSA